MDFSVCRRLWYLGNAILRTGGNWRERSEVFLERVGIHIAAEAIGAVFEHKEVIAAVGKERVDRHTVGGARVYSHAIDLDGGWINFIASPARKFPCIFKAGRNLQNAGGGLAAAHELLFEQGLDLSAVQGHGHHAVAERLDREHFAVGYFAGQFTSADLIVW